MYDLKRTAVSIMNCVLRCSVWLWRTMTVKTEVPRTWKDWNRLDSAALVVTSIIFMNRTWHNWIDESWSSLCTYMKRYSIVICVVCVSLKQYSVNEETSRKLHVADSCLFIVNLVSVDIPLKSPLWAMVSDENWAFQKASEWERKKKKS